MEIHPEGGQGPSRAVWYSQWIEKERGMLLFIFAAFLKSWFGASSLTSASKSLFTENSTCCKWLATPHGWTANWMFNLFFYLRWVSFDQPASFWMGIVAVRKLALTTHHHLVLILEQGRAIYIYLLTIYGYIACYRENFTVLTGRWRGVYSFII